ncbi:unnamed protein product, partial [Ectocarpus sp. 12 AP-2014]
VHKACKSVNTNHDGCCLQQTIEVAEGRDEVIIVAKTAALRTKGVRFEVRQGAGCASKGLVSSSRVTRTTLMQSSRWTGCWVSRRTMPTTKPPRVPR